MMKPSVVLSALVLAVGVGGLVVTNPSPEDYARYAGQQAEQYFTAEVCTGLPPGFAPVLGDQCTEMVQALQPQMETLIRDRTERLNLGVASIYRTSFGLPQLEMLPEYRVETLGILGRFFTYRAERIR
jgi:hypothetical protein